MNCEPTLRPETYNCTVQLYNRTALEPVPETLCIPEVRLTAAFRWCPAAPGSPPPSVSTVRLASRTSHAASIWPA